jgi:hypothetical protein
MARVAARQVLLVDTVNMGDAVEEAEAIRDPSHVRNYSVDEWHDLLAAAGLDPLEVRVLEHPIDLAAWLARTGCTGADAERATALLGERVSDGTLTLDKVAIRAAVR